MKDSYRYMIRNSDIYRQGFNNPDGSNPYKGGTIEWLQFLVGKDARWNEELTTISKNIVAAVFAK